ncbi:putative aminoglycoside phosphotransferase [Bifidobacterium actinocoloniiforme DSM 22766]|uniref:Putative aminoglycoside phosphotransferase n=1 Tax=Bifidobacterium actinocoloniiforme DSM 22766 TaxID=1437605 RepID=A0A086YZM6_9BIFI|nr:phosphotransferase [Bifidobacterium actinocoloniiforme]KFI39726.1 putative aminoglycoside phosphotransferase [Bifidobacterium actinocoloniiforme DSM 22766]
MTERTKLTLVALASAVMPEAYFTGARASDQASPQDEAEGIDCAIVQNASGRLYDIWATSSEQGKIRLNKRVKAAEALEDVRGVRALGFGVEQVVRYENGANPKGPTGDVAVAIMTHAPGHTQSLKLLTNEECSAVGTAIGAIHRIDPRALRERFYPAYSTDQIADQLKSWIASLRKAGHVPREITDSWSRIVRTEGLWSFDTCMVHGGFADGDLLFSNSGLSAVHNWQNMQVNDPARDLAWTFAKLDQAGRDAVISAYGRMMGSRLDDLIMLRANLWLQMEQVGDFILALEQADNDRIIRFKAQVERLAQQLADSLPKTYSPATAGQLPERGGGHGEDMDDAPSTVTIGALLDADQANPADPATDSGPAPVKTTPSVEDDATVVRPVYRRPAEGQDGALVNAPTGRHAAVRPPTLPDMTSSHRRPTTLPQEPSEDSSHGRHSIQPRSDDEAREDGPTNTRTEAIDLSRMRELAHAQAERAHRLEERKRHSQETEITHKSDNMSGKDGAIDSASAAGGNDSNGGDGWNAAASEHAHKNDRSGEEQEAPTIVIEQSNPAGQSTTRSVGLAGTGSDDATDGEHPDRSGDDSQERRPAAASDAKPAEGERSSERSDA